MPTVEATITAKEAGLHKSLSKAQVVMIGLGGAIGTGLFAGSALAMALAQVDAMDSEHLTISFRPVRSASSATLKG